jgi:multiple sugar transport system permease protein
MNNVQLSKLQRFRQDWFNLRRQEALSGYLFILPFIFFFVVFVIRPVFAGIWMSFHQWEILMPHQPFIGLDNYRELLNDDLWWTALRNTTYFAILTVIGNTIVALAAALIVTQPIRGQGFYRVVFYAPVLMSVAVVGVLWGWLFNTQFGIINHVLSFVGIGPVRWLADPNLVIPSLSLTTIWWGFGFPMLIFMAGIQNIPGHLYDAAKVDGADAWGRFVHITIPLLRPTILFVTVTQFIAHFQVFGQPYIMTGGGPGRSSLTVIMYLYQTAWRYFRMGYGSAMAVSLAIVIIIFTIIQFQLFRDRGGKTS